MPCGLSLPWPPAAAAPSAPAPPAAGASDGVAGSKSKFSWLELDSVVEAVAPGWSRVEETTPGFKEDWNCACAETAAERMAAPRKMRYEQAKNRIRGVQRGLNMP